VSQTLFNAYSFDPLRTHSLYNNHIKDHVIHKIRSDFATLKNFRHYSQLLLKSNRAFLDIQKLTPIYNYTKTKT